MFLSRTVLLFTLGLFSFWGVASLRVKGMLVVGILVVPSCIAGLIFSHYTRKMARRIAANAPENTWKR